jgi:hypothetical protein
VTALAAVLASGWRNVLWLYGYFTSFLIVNITVEGYEAHAMMQYLREVYRISRFGPRAYVGFFFNIRPLRRTQLVAMEDTTRGAHIYWHGWRPLWSRPGGLRTNLGDGTFHGVRSQLTFIRGTFNADQLVLAATEHFNQHLAQIDNESQLLRGRRHYIRHVHGSDGKPAQLLLGQSNGDAPAVPLNDQTNKREIMVNRLLGLDWDDIGPNLPARGGALNQLALSDTMQEVVASLRRWLSAEAWYRQRGIPWRFNQLFYGKPGTGKTATIRAIAEDFDLPIFVYDLATLYNDELRNGWLKMLAEVPAIALIEDIDAVFEGRENKRGHLTFDCLLNCLDGVERADGLLVFITTNRPEVLDSALATWDATERTVSAVRPGRIDRAVHVTELDDSGRLQLAKRVLAEYPATWDQLVAEGSGDTGAEFQERCRSLALELYWSQQREADCSCVES